MLIVLEFLITDPSYQRQGLARRLIQPVLDLADEQQRIAYVAASDRGYKLYSKCGWQVVDHMVFDLSK